jgi:hypothetical protein
VWSTGVAFHEMLHYLCDAVRIFAALSWMMKRNLQTQKQSSHWMKNSELNSTKKNNRDKNFDIGFFAPFLLFLETNANGTQRLQYYAVPLVPENITLDRPEDGWVAKKMFLDETELLYHFFAPEQKKALREKKSFPNNDHTLSYQFGILLRFLLFHPSDDSPLNSQAFGIKPAAAGQLQDCHNIISHRGAFTWTHPSFIPIISFLRFACDGLIHPTPARRISIKTIKDALDTIVFPSPDVSVLLYASDFDKYIFLETATNYYMSSPKESFASFEEKTRFSFGSLGWSFLIEPELFRLFGLKSNDKITYPEERSLIDLVSLLNKMCRALDTQPPFILCDILNAGMSEEECKMITVGTRKNLKKLMISFIESRFPFLLPSFFNDLHKINQISSALRRINAKFAFSLD